MASSPTPRDELDEKLNEALIGLYTRNAEGEFIPVDDKADVLKDEIKQAFKDAGYLTPEEAKKIYEGVHEIKMLLMEHID